MSVIELEPVDYYCATCDSAMEWTACDAPYCMGYRCLNCGEGCDLYQDPEDGTCAIDLASLPLELAGEIRADRRHTGRYPHIVQVASLPGGECA